MAGLPNNTSYQSPSTKLTVPKVSKSFKQQIEALRGDFNKGVADALPSSVAAQTGPTPSDIANQSNIVPTNYTFKPTNPNPTIPTGKTFVDKSVDIKRSQPLSESGYKATYAWGEKPGKNAVIKTTPTMGQYIIDSKNPNKIYRSERPDVETWNSIRKRALDGRDTDMYEVDHVIPLWLGGTNNQENLQVIDRQTHSNKVKAEAVALTLFANKKIDKTEALRMAMMWKSRDLTNFPEVTRTPVMADGQTSGQMNLTEAEKVYAKWKQQENTIQKVSMFKDFFKKDTALSRGDYIDKKTEWMPDFLQGITKGFLNAGSMNAIQYRKSANDGGADETFGRVIGAIGGSFLPIVGIGKIFGAARGLSKVKQGVTSSLRLKGILKGSTAVGNTAVNLTEGVASGVTKAKNILPFSKGAVDPRVQSLIRAHSDNFVKWTPPVVLYGQASVSFEDKPERGARLFEDIVYGGLTGFMAPNIKGAAKAAFFAGSASMMFDAYSTERDVSWENALVNGLMIGGLHQFSSPGIRKQAEVELQKESTRMANNIVGLYVPRLKSINPGGELPVYTKEEVAKITKEAKDTLLKQVGGSSDGNSSTRMDDEEFGRQYQALGAALDVLNMRALNEGEIPGYLSTRMKQWSDLANDPMKRDAAFGGVTPKKLGEIMSNVPLDLLENSIPYKKTTLYPSGIGRTTGLAKDFHPNILDVHKLIRRSADGRVSPTLVAISRPERTTFNKLLSADVRKEWNDSNPANTVQVFARSIDGNGKVEILNVGYLSQEGRVEGKKYSFNSQSEIQNKKFDPYDKNINKDTINEKMIAEGIDYLLISFRKAGYKKNVDGTLNKNQPYLEFGIGEQNWTRSIDIQRNGGAGVAPKVAVDGADAVLNRVNTAKNKDAVQAAKNDYLQNQKEPAYKALDNASLILPADEGESIAMAKSLLESGSEALSKPTVKEMSDNIYDTFGFRLSDEAANVLFEKRRGITVSSFFKLVEKNSNETMKFVYNEQIAPALRKLTEKSGWDKAKIFNEMRVADASTPIPKVTEINKPVVARETVAVPPTKELSTNPKTRALSEKVASVAEVKTPEILPRPSPETVAKRQSIAKRKRVSEGVANIAEVIIPSSVRVRTTRQARIDQIAQDTIDEGINILNQIRHRKNGDEDYIKALSSVVRNVELKVNPAASVGGGYPLNRKEKAFILQDVMSSLASEANKIYNGTVDVASTINFKVGGMKKGDPYYSAVEQIQNAMNAKAVGRAQREDPIAAVRAKLGDKTFEKAYKLLNPNIGDAVKNIGLSKEAIKRKSIGFKGGLLGDIYMKDLQINSGKGVIADFIDRPLKEAKDGTYMSVFADVVDTTLTKLIGKEWRNDEGLLVLFSGLNNPKEANIWENLLVRSEGDATQPIEYIMLKAKGLFAKSKRIADARREQSYAEKMGRLDTLSNRNIIGDGIVTNSTPLPEGTREINQSQVTDIVAPSPMDTIMAGFTKAINNGGTPTPEAALADSMQFMFQVNRGRYLGLNTDVATSVIDEVIGRVKQSGAKLSDATNPKKTARKLFVEAKQKRSEANDLLKGDLFNKYSSLIASKSPGKTPYAEMKYVKKAESLPDKIKALGAAMNSRDKDATYGVWKSKQTKEELLFTDAFRKFQKLMTESDELNRAKEIVKVDIKK